MFDSVSLRNSPIPYTKKWKWKWWSGMTLDIFVWNMRIARSANCTIEIEKFQNRKKFP
jgi:hypothetical protein